MTVAAQHIGDFDPAATSRADLSLHLDNAALRAWHQGPRVTDYVCGYSLRLLEDRVAPADREVIAAGLAFALSELLENVAKFSIDERVDICVDDNGTELVLSIENALEAEAAAAFAQRAEKIANGDPLMMMLEQVEAQAERPELSGSGLGLLTMINDYGARLGWSFAPSDERETMWRVTIMVRFSFNEIMGLDGEHDPTMNPVGSEVNE